MLFLRLQNRDVVSLSPLEQEDDTVCTQPLISSVCKQVRNSLLIIFIKTHQNSLFSSLDHFVLWTTLNWELWTIKSESGTQCKADTCLQITAAGCHQIASQHSGQVLSQCDGTVNHAEAAWWSKIDQSDTLTWIYCARFALRRSIFLQPKQRHQKRVLQIAGVKGLRPPRDGFIPSSSLMRCPIHSGTSLTCMVDWLGQSVSLAPRTHACA